MTRKRIVMVFLITAALLSACGPASTPPPAQPAPERPLRPTFTPTVPATATALPTDTPMPTPTALPSNTPTPAAAKAQVGGDGQVNVRSGPGTAYDEIGQAATGAELDIVARDAAGDWYQVCCINEQNAWIVARLVTVMGDPALVPVAQDIPEAPTASAAPVIILPTPRPTAPPVQPAATAAPAPTAPPQPSFAFDKLSTETRINTNAVVTIFGLGWENDSKTPARGFKLVVDGPAGRGEGALGDLQYGDAGLPGQFLYNAKVEFIGGPTGVYRAYLADSSGNAVSEAWEYTVAGEQRTFVPRWKKR